MIKDVCSAAASMLGRPDEAEELLSDKEGKKNVL